MGLIMLKKQRTIILLAVLVISSGALLIDRIAGAKAAERAMLYQHSTHETIHRFVNLYWGRDHVHQKTKWMGIKIQQAPTDMWSFQEIIYDVKPDYIIEAGTYMGGSALYFASILHVVNPGGRIITIDIKDVATEAKRNPLFQHYVTSLIGSSIDDSILSEVGRLVSGKTALVFLDSDHHADHVYKEMIAYA